MRSFRLFLKLTVSLAIPLVLGAGCATVEEDFAGAVDTTMAPLVTVDAAARIPDQYIVVFKDSVGTANMKAAMSRISLVSPGSRIEHTYDIIPGFSARLAPKELDAIRRNPDVAYVEQDQLMHATGTRPASGELGIDVHDHCPAENDGIFDDHGCTGTGVLIYVVDTGIRATHTQFGGRVNTARGFTAIADGRGTTDCNGHGTHVASTAAGATFGMASAATLVPVRVLGCTGSGSNAGVINGVNHVANNCLTSERCVANMSLGGGVSATLDSAVANAVSRGIPFAVAAGNDNQDAGNSSPAREPSVITVGCSADGTFPAPPGVVARCSFSNFGSVVDIWASGLTIVGADDGSDSQTQTISGTSMSSPHVAGAIAQMMSTSCKGKLTPAQVAAQLDAKAIPGILSIPPGENLFLCNDFNDNDGINACACTGNPPPPPPPPPVDGCVQNNACGGQAPAGCFCDSVCVQFGDCCPDGPC